MNSKRINLSGLREQFPEYRFKEVGMMRTDGMMALAARGARLPLHEAQGVETYRVIQVREPGRFMVRGRLVTNAEYVADPELGGYIDFQPPLIEDGEYEGLHNSIVCVLFDHHEEGD